LDKRFLGRNPELKGLRGQKLDAVKSNAAKTPDNIVKDFFDINEDFDKQDN
jgi:hypothetical protein